jgi:hypothetical protein
LDAYFCYIHRAGRAVPQFRVLVCDSDDDLDEEAAVLAAEYPHARLDIYREESFVKTFPPAAGWAGKAW